MGAGSDDDKRRHDTCEEWKNSAMKDAYVRFMVAAMATAGCRIDASYFKCQPCDRLVGGGLYYDDDGNSSVILCENRLTSESQTATVAAHELIHAFDNCRAHHDPGNLQHHACTEIRAASLSGDCRFMNEIMRGHYKVMKQHQACVRRRAILSVRMNPNCQNDEQAATAVDSVWDTCFADTAPFERLP
ncbi:Mitochondrial inner membrane protease ATP23 [Plasmodiophora brassicae]|nr:hypothetical protein PBRA_000796 [Plasmodiophora brassicae]